MIFDFVLTGRCHNRDLDYIHTCNIHAIPYLLGSTTQQTCEGELSGAHKRRCTYQIFQRTI